MAETEAKSILELALDETQEARLDAEADAETEAGKGVPHERVREWLLRLVEGEKSQPPEQ